MKGQSTRRSKRLAAQVLEQQQDDVKQQKLSDDLTQASKVHDKKCGLGDFRPLEQEVAGTDDIAQSQEKVVRPRRQKGPKVKTEDPATTGPADEGAPMNRSSAQKLEPSSKETIQVKRENNTEASKSEVTKEMAGFIAKGGKFIGAHTSSAGGIWNAVTNAVSIEGRAFALFLKSQRQWKAKPLEEDMVTRFKATMEECGYHPDYVLPHGSYLLNCGSPNPETLQKSREALLEEVQRCQRLGLNRYNFHPGSTCGEIAVDECLDLISESINQVLRQTSGVTLVVENMSCQGNTIGGKFEELRDIIDRVEDKSRIGVCLDTCHAFAAGYDLSTDAGFSKMTEDFERLVGFHYLKGVHLNDSKGKVGCHLDRHENIGKGFIGLNGFKRLMNDQRFNNVPMILETPPGADYRKEIKLLYSLID